MDNWKIALFLTAIILSAVLIENVIIPAIHRPSDLGDVFPSNAVLGQLFFRTDLDRLYLFNGSTWDFVGAKEMMYFYGNYTGDGNYNQTIVANWNLEPVYIEIISYDYENFFPFSWWKGMLDKDAFDWMWWKVLPDTMSNITTVGFTVHNSSQQGHPNKLDVLYSYMALGWESSLVD